MYNSSRLTFQDLSFSHDFFMCKDRSGKITRRWLPYGMPTLSPGIENCVFFLYGTHPKNGELIGPGGTGFIVGRPSTPPDFGTHYYAVTNWHVVFGNIGYSYIRQNTKNETNSSRFLYFEPHEWQFIKEYDVAAIDITDHMDGTCVHRNIFPSEFATNFEIEKLEIGMGEDVFMIGYFSGHSNEDRNLPAVRFGNISRIANEKYPINIDEIGLLPCHMVDMRSRPGLSGSPVFVYRVPTNDLRYVNAYGSSEKVYLGSSNDGHNRYEPGWGITTENRLFLRLLGIHCSQFQEYIEVEAEHKIIKETKGSIIKAGDNLIIPSSMTIVIPADRIIKLLDLPYFEEQRMKRDTDAKQQKTGIWKLESTTKKSEINQQEGDKLLKTLLNTPPETHEEMKGKK